VIARARFTPRRRFAAALPPVLLLAAVTEVGLRCVPLEVLCRGLGIRIGRERGRAPAPLVQLTERERAVLRTVEGVYRWLGPAERGTCLRRALVGGALLRKRAPVLRLGCTRVEGRIRAHAWLELAAPVATRDAAPAAQAATLGTASAARFTSLGVAGSRTLGRDPRGRRLT
jgi:hypothetical protein